MSRGVRSAAQRAHSVAVFSREWLVPALILLVIALADGLVRTVALAAFVLVVAAKLLLVASSWLRRVAPVGPAAHHARRRSTSRRSRGGRR